MSRKRVDSDVKLSKSLSYTLRHGAAKQGIAMAKDGTVLVADLLQHPSYRHCSLTDIERVVRNNNKQRFALLDGPGGWRICANQGHTVEVEDLELEAITDAAQLPVAVHGTYLRHWGAIRAGGLSRMQRNHVHLAAGLPNTDGVISGMRHNSQLYIYIDVAAAMKDNMHFYRSRNGVILTDGFDGCIPPKYFASVIRFDTQEDLLKT